MDYTERLTCFVDLLGFGDAVRESVTKPEITEAFFKIFSDFKDGGLEKAIYSVIPYLDQDGLKNCGEKYGDQLIDNMGSQFDFVVTQFSDSIVLSAPANNKNACALLIRALMLVHLQVFFGVGMLMRGGIAVGKLVHVRGGALFGPAMNEAYSLESKHAIYSRVIISQSAEGIVRHSLRGGNLESALFKCFDGYAGLDLVSFVEADKHYKLRRDEIRAQLGAIELDIISNAPHAHPKIAYLLDRWEAIQGG